MNSFTKAFIKLIIIIFNKLNSNCEFFPIDAPTFLRVNGILITLTAHRKHGWPTIQLNTQPGIRQDNRIRHSPGLGPGQAGLRATASRKDKDQKEIESLYERIAAVVFFRLLFAHRAVRKATLGAATERIERAFKMQYLYYILAVLVLGLISINVVRFSTRSKNPEALKIYKSRQAGTGKHSSRKTLRRSRRNSGSNTTSSSALDIKSLRERHQNQVHHRTPWGWPGSERRHASQGVSETMRGFADRLIKEKQLVQPNGNVSIRALLEDRYSPVNREMTEIPYQKVKRPLLRDPSEQFDQLDNLGSAKARHLRKKLQLLSAMNPVDAGEDGKTTTRKKTGFRYVDLKDLKQPWGW